MATRFVTNPRRPATRRNPSVFGEDYVEKVYGDWGQYGDVRAKELVSLAKAFGGTAKASAVRNSGKKVTVRFSKHSWFASTEAFKPFAAAFSVWDARRAEANRAWNRDEGPNPDTLDLVSDLMPNARRKNPRRSSGREIETMSYIEAMDTTRPKYTSRSPEELLLTRMLALKTLKQKFADKSPREVAKALGFDPNDASIISVLEELRSGPYNINPARKYAEGREDAGYRKLSDLKRGEFFKRKADARKTYRKGDYDRSERKYEAMDEDDISRSTYLKGDVLVYVGFNY